MTTTNAALKQWVEEVASLTTPDRIHWCSGSEQENQELVENMLRDGTLIELDPRTHPQSYLHLSHPTDVARTEHLTFICTSRKDDAGPTNNWMEPDEAHGRLDQLLRGSMKGRTMFVVPYVMGPIDSPYAQGGVEITDSPYVVANMRIMTRMGQPALKRIEHDGYFVKGLHSLGDLSPERRLIMHFPEEDLIESVGSGYGGNALLGKKCHALRIASWKAREQGWMAEHMLIMGVESPEGETHYLCAAFPSACGKTNLAMLVPPESMKGWRVWTVGEDIAWLNLGHDGRLWAINPEAGYFGVAPGTSPDTNSNAVKMLARDTIFTNVAHTDDRRPWWEGLSKAPPRGLVDWQGRAYDPANGPAAHPNSRFTVSAKRNPMYSPRTEDPLGVPITAILFGGRRSSLVPLVYQSVSWRHGVLVGAALSSETTAAATGKVGVLRRDPMAMLPFCGYNMGEYWQHWLAMGNKSDKLPKIFHVNWFRRDASGRFLWPGYGENLRVLRWIIERCRGNARGVRTPIGTVPLPADLDTLGLKADPADLHEITRFHPEGWREEMAQLGTYLAGFGPHLPAELQEEYQRIASELNGA
ncbi:MAG: phosphoenolpyruvate carboxykinase (GTP) [Candidatus Lambdaproteobacteria bacterium]|nr:phosphoenolpyruvate carboxykinase (GTP) [Candidatus Lambdaproteobacteria bacterium]